MQAARGTASSMRKQKRKGESGGTERGWALQRQPAAGGRGASLLLLVRGAIYCSLQRGQKIAKRWGGRPGCTPPLCLPVPSAPKTWLGTPFATRQAADKPGKPPLSSPVSRASPAPLLILTVASTFPSPSRVLPSSLPSTSALGPPLGAGHTLSTLCGTPTWAPKHSVKLSEFRDISVALMPSFRSPRACGNRASD